MKLTSEQYFLRIELYFTYAKSPIRAARAFNTHCRNNNIECPIVTEADIRRTVKKLKIKGTINRRNKRNSGRPPSAVTETNAIVMMGRLFEKQEIFSLKCASDSNLPRSSLQHICKKILKLYPYSLLGPTGARTQ